MYMSKWKEYDSFLDKLGVLDGVVDLFCMVDSFGGVMPEDGARDYSHREIQNFLSYRFSWS